MKNLRHKFFRTIFCYFIFKAENSLFSFKIRPNKAFSITHPDTPFRNISPMQTIAERSFSLKHKNNCITDTIDIEDAMFMILFGATRCNVYS